MKFFSVRPILYCLAVMLTLSSLVHAAQGAPNQKDGVEKQTAPEPQPFISIPEPDYVFGEVMEGVEVEHDYKVNNPGMGELIIDRVRTS